MSCSKPCRNFCPVAVCAVALPGALPLDPGGPERLSDAARDVTEPPGCVAIDVSDEFAALPFRCAMIFCPRDFVFR